ncbi:lactate dehydrogenase [Eremomyces bilateralis CBS 781.70]|uniref:Lactate dehydrogenase n=1 Tax=Eremomyces bilateralis CBS 781.70 TaxID=1392243 RepID=A0A6G1FWI4_9PEZI|nr:lactate dehydrogenase [Eremomyces bilateralis CBS 781.70]KAF1810143.1 lactate dehydrogenase [Eremomyces bilateralis CBS 781.70]
MITRIAIVGAGTVGATAAYALLLGSVANEILLVDIKTDRRDGQAHDLSDAAYSTKSSSRIRSATYHEAGECDIVIITAGSKQNVGHTSVELEYRNISTLKSVIHAMKPHFRHDTILLVVANPVDVLTTIALGVSGLPRSQVIGSGTFLDSVRLRGLLADKAGAKANSIGIYVLGVQGETQFIAWSAATFGGVPIDKALPIDTIDRIELADQCKHVARTIIQAKGTISFGIGAIVASICSSILNDKRDVRPLTTFQPDLGCCVSLPVVLGRKGAIRTIPVELNEEEKKTLEETAKALKVEIEQVRGEL